MTKVRFADEEMDGQFSRSLYVAYYTSADLGEAFATADRLGESPSYDEWFREWAETANRAFADADRSRERGHQISARRAYLRATEYFRQAIFYIRKDLTDERLLSGYRRHRKAFRAAAALLECPVETVAIPYEGTTLEGYLARPDESGEPRRTLVFPCGYDSTAEAGWAMSAADAVARGCNALMFDGPGQGSTLYLKGIPFRHDFEAVLTPVLDWVVQQPGVDPARIVVVGRSFAGYLAPRGTAFDNRVAALVCDPGQFALDGGRFAQLLGQDVVDRALAGDTTVDEVLEQKRASSPRMAEMFGARMAAHEVKTVREWIVEIQRWTLEGLVHRISCPTLIVEGASDVTGGQSQQLYDALVCPKRLEVLSAAVGADGHCGGLGQMTWSQVVYDWLDETLP